MANLDDGELNLKQAAAVLGVHYMTVYRYVRTGQLAAHRVGTNWVLRRSDLDDFRQRLYLVALDPSRDEPTPWRDRLRIALMTGDETGGWRIIEQALVAGCSPADCYLDLIVGALNDISQGPEVPGAPIAREYLAISTASRLAARLGARFRRPGRSRGTIIFGAPLGDYHAFPISVVADLVRLSGFDCLELGANVPPEIFAGTAREAPRLVAVGIGVTMATSLNVLSATVAAVKGIEAEIPVVLGGQGAGDAQVLATGATAWAGDGRSAVVLFEELSATRRATWLLAR
ncbi:MAG TPA: helix-turn-helix domain-containing protein [Acidimicrobiales bacterium]